MGQHSKQFCETGFWVMLPFDVETANEPIQHGNGTLQAVTSHMKGRQNFGAAIKVHLWPLNEHQYNHIIAHWTAVHIYARSFIISNFHHFIFILMICNVLHQLGFCFCIDICLLSFMLWCLCLLYNLKWEKTCNKVYRIIYPINDPHTYLSSNVEWTTSSFNRNSHK